MYEVCSKLYRNDAISQKVHMVARLREDNPEAVICKSSLTLPPLLRTGLVSTAGASGATLRHRPSHTQGINTAHTHTT